MHIYNHTLWSFSRKDVVYHLLLTSGLWCALPCSTECWMTLCIQAMSGLCQSAIVVENTHPAILNQSTYKAIGIQICIQGSVQSRFITCRYILLSLYDCQLSCTKMYNMRRRPVPLKQWECLACKSSANVCDTQMKRDAFKNQILIHYPWNSACFLLKIVFFFSNDSLIINMKFLHFTWQAELWYNI